MPVLLCNDRVFHTWGVYFIFFNCSVVGDIDSMILESGNFDSFICLLTAYPDNASAMYNS